MVSVFPKMPLTLLLDSLYAVNEVYSLEIDIDKSVPETQKLQRALLPLQKVIKNAEALVERAEVEKFYAEMRKEVGEMSVLFTKFNITVPILPNYDEDQEGQTLIQTFSALQDRLRGCNAVWKEQVHSDLKTKTILECKQQDLMRVKESRRVASLRVEEVKEIRAKLRAAFPGSIIEEVEEKPMAILRFINDRIMSIARVRSPMLSVLLHDANYYIV